MLFPNRRDAGRRLAAKLMHYGDRPDVIVLALPRGGVPVAYEVAKALHAPLEVFQVRKLGVPGHEELAFGAIASTGVRVLNPDVIESLDLTNEQVEEVTEQEQRELERRERVYRNGRPVPEVLGRTVILIDDGLATGSTMRAAAKALRQQHPARLVVAVPVAAAPTCREFSEPVDEVICAITPEPFDAVGVWYRDFSQTSDEEVRKLLGQPQPVPVER